jgi:Rrf2 family protein
MVNLAGCYDDAPVSARILAEQEDISYQFTCKILQKLHKAGLVASSMGPKGGFSLARPPSGTTALEVIEALQGPLSVNKCLLGNAGCPRQPGCAVSAKLGQLQEHIDLYLRNITLDHFQRSRVANRQTRDRKATGRNK